LLKADAVKGDIISPACRTVLTFFLLNNSTASLIASILSCESLIIPIIVLSLRIKKGVDRIYSFSNDPVQAD
jgi:hypothetical protein